MLPCAKGVSTLLGGLIYVLVLLTAGANLGT